MPWRVEVFPDHCAVKSDAVDAPWLAVRFDGVRNQDDYVLERNACHALCVFLGGGTRPPILNGMNRIAAGLRASGSHSMVIEAVGPMACIGTGATPLWRQREDEISKQARRELIDRLVSQ
jgi:hypothetical protein